MARNETPRALTAMGRLAPMVNGQQPDQLWSVVVHFEAQNGETITLAEIVVANSYDGADKMARNKASARIDRRFAWVVTTYDHRPLPLHYVDVNARGITRRVRINLTRFARALTSVTNDQPVILANVGEPRDA